MYLHEHLEKLRYFYEVARLGSMKKASEAVFITQPSLSKSMRVLENAIGHELFIRLPRGVSLTKEGEILFSYCHEFFGTLGDLEKKLENSTDPMAGSLRVGTYDSIGIYFWPKFLKNFLPLYPNLSLEVSTGRSRAVQGKLESGELDLILIVDPRKSTNILVEKIKTDSFYLYASTKKKLVYSELKSAPLILMPDSFASELTLGEKLTEIGLSERQTYTTSSLESVKELTSHGIGLGFLPEMVAKDLVEKKQLKKVTMKGIPKNGAFKHDIGLAYQKSRHGHKLIAKVIEEIKVALSQM